LQCQPAIYLILGRYLKRFKCYFLIVSVINYHYLNMDNRKSRMGNAMSVFCQYAVNPKKLKFWS